MASNQQKFVQGIVLIPTASPPTGGENGELSYRSSDDSYIASHAGTTGRIVLDNAGQSITATNISITGSATVNNATVTGTLTSSGTSIVNSLTVTGNLSVSGTETLAGALTVNNNTSITGTLGVSGAATINNNLTITGNLAISGTEIINGALTVNNNVSITGTLGVSGVASLGSALDFTQISTPSNPTAGHNRIYTKSTDKLYILNSAGTEIPVGSAQANGALNWTEGANSPIPLIEYGQTVYAYETSYDQILSSWFKVPDTFVSGSQLKLKMSWYCDDSVTGNGLIHTTAYLIRPGTDAVSSVALPYLSTNTTANFATNKPTTASMDLSTTAGAISGVTVLGGYLIRIDLARGTDSATGVLKAIVNSYELVLG